MKTGSPTDYILSRFPDRYLWDLLDDIAFWIKDRDGCFIWVNQTLVAQAGASRARITGTRDSDWFLNELASVYMQDDAKVLATGTPLINKVELVIRPDGDISWHRTSKFALCDASGEVIATYGSTRPMEKAASLPQAFADLARVIQFVRDGMPSGIGVAQLARQAGISVSTLERLVQQQLRLTPQQLLLRMRMNRARHLLGNSTLAISAVAEACGYESASSFCRAFKHYCGRRPGEIRQ
jgi:AraC-like DNA-binding protein